MRRGRGLFLLLLLVVLSSAAAAGEPGSVTLYIQRVVVSDRGAVRLGSLVQPVGGVPPAAGETLALSVATLGDRMLYIPSRSYADSLQASFGPDSIIVGSGSLVIPRGLVPPEELPLMGKLVDFLTDQGILGAARADIDLRLNEVRGPVSVDSSPAFQLVRSAMGSVEVSFDTGPGDGAARGRLLLGVSGPPPGTRDVRASDPVQVVFHKGPITIEMEGRALSAASVGDMVTVRVPDSQRSFSGRLAPGKAVDVELP